VQVPRTHAEKVPRWRDSIHRLFPL
jgi:hypothetical protein